jgi:uncharacterized membrane protein HdeD (DUF308 family)
METTLDRLQRTSLDGGFLDDNWSWLALRGGLALVLGVLAILFPGSALFAFTMVFAAFALIDGFLSLASGIGGARHKHERWWALIARGLVGILVGIIFMLMPYVTTLGYALASLALLAIWSIFTGALEIAAAVKLRKEIEGEWLLGLSGLLSVLLGMAIPIVLALYPAATILSVGWLIGVYALAAGIVLIGQSFRLSRRSNQMHEEGDQRKGGMEMTAAPAG